MTSHNKLVAAHMLSTAGLVMLSFEPRAPGVGLIGLICVIFSIIFSIAAIQD